jgi:hypothetical protein
VSRIVQGLLFAELAGPFFKGIPPFDAIEIDVGGLFPPLP